MRLKERSPGSWGRRQSYEGVGDLSAHILSRGDASSEASAFVAFLALRQGTISCAAPPNRGALTAPTSLTLHVPVKEASEADVRGQTSELKGC